MSSRGTVFLAAIFLLACWRGAAPAPQGEVVFVCEHGAAKSVVAMAHFNRLASERGLAVRAVARGADPQPALAPSALKGLRADGLDPGLDAPRPLTAADVRASVLVIAFDCAEPAMKALAGADSCWDDVPAVGEGYARARETIRGHVSDVVDRLAAR